MTVAVDIRTGRIVGQVAEAQDRVRSTADLGTRYRRAVEEARREQDGRVRLLTQEGYIYVPRASVRLEEV